jgi:uncharacterized membrane protein HdeD (DUF308 family)
MVTDLAGRFGMTTQAAGVLLLVFGVLIIALPQILHWLVGILLIALGVLALVGGGADAWLTTRTRGPAEPPRRV